MTAANTMYLTLNGKPEMYYLFNQQQMNNINQQLQEHVIAKAMENVTVPVIETADEDGEYLSRDETARLLHIDKSTLHRWTKDGKLSCVKVGPRRVLYQKEEVKAMLQCK